MSTSPNALSLAVPVNADLATGAVRSTRHGLQALVRSPVTLVVVFTIALIALIWDGIHVRTEATRELAFERARRDNINLARAFAEHSERILEGADQALLLIRQQYEKSPGRIDLAEFARDGMIAGRLFGHVGVLDEHGTHQAGNLAETRRSGELARAHLAAHAARDTDAPFVARPVPADGAGRWSLQLSRRINKRDGSFGGVVVISVDPARFSRVYGELDLGYDGMAGLVGNDGIVRARHAGGDLVMGQDISGSLLAEHLRVGDSGSFRALMAPDAPPRLVSYNKLSAYPLAVAVGQSERAILAPWEPVERNTLICGFLATIGLLVFATIVARLLRALPLRGTPPWG